MKIRSILAAIAAAAFVALPAFAQTPSIEVSHAWLRATPKTAPVAGGYATITNKGATPDTLISASLPTAPKGEIHTMSMLSNGVMHMRRLDKGLTIAPGESITLKPGGDHLMFVKPTEQLREGETVKGSLTFAKAGTLPVTFAVSGMAAKSAPGTKSAPDASDPHAGHDMSGMGMKGMH